MKQLRYGSICSGVAPQTEAWKALGLECAWFSEIEPFPSAVLKHRFPEIPNLGDFTQIGNESGPINLLVGGTPCQSFSVAGKRAGLDDPRGNLTLEFARLAQRLRPRWLVWENVPGVLSIDGGRTFGTFLGILGQLGYGFAYRVLDSQYFGVAQRRRRVFVVGCLGNWRAAAAVLFERESLSGNPAPSRETKQNLAGTLRASFAKGSGVRGISEQTLVDVAPTLNAHFGDKQGLEDQHIRGGAGLFVLARSSDAGDGARLQGAEELSGRRVTELRSDRVSFDPIAFSAKDHGADASQDVVPTPRAGGFDKSHANSGNWMAVAFAENQRGEIRTSEISPQLSCTGGKPGSGYPAVAVQESQTGCREYDTAGTLRADGPGHDPVGTRVRSGMAVRRLTPRECERLQGFEDDYTLIPWRGKMAPDGPRYKAIGNSWAVPVLNWLAKRIVEVCEQRVEG